MNNWFNKNGIHLAIIAAFVVICFIYFSPVLQGKAPAQSDVLQSKAMQKEIMEYKDKDGKGPLWTNQMFGGMPEYPLQSDLYRLIKQKEKRLYPCLYVSLSKSKCLSENERSEFLRS